MAKYLLQISIKSKERVEMTLYRETCHQLFKLTMQYNLVNNWSVMLVRCGDPERMNGRNAPDWENIAMALPSLYMTDVLDVVKWGRGLMNALCSHHYEIDWSVNA